MSPKASPVAGLLLAGGQSSRFGVEKAAAPFGPGLLMDGPLQALAASCDAVAVSAKSGSGAAAIAETAGYPVLTDPASLPEGPLRGVLAGLEWAAEHDMAWLVTAPCDAATLTADQVAALIDAAREHEGAAAARSERGVEPLIAAWPVAASLSLLKPILAEGRHPSVRSVLDALGLVETLGFDGVNINTQADLAALALERGEEAAPAHARLFRFEDDFVRTLRCIPMCVRFKLDRVEIKLSLRQWSRFTLADRIGLRLAPCATDAETSAYREALAELIWTRATEDPIRLARQPEPEWLEPEPPAQLIAFARDKGVPAPSVAGWRSLTELQRYTLVKLTRDKHENANFGPAMKEFGLL